MVLETDMNKRDFIKLASKLSLGALTIPRAWSKEVKKNKIRTAHIGVGGMGFNDLTQISSHPFVEVVGLCDVDSINLKKAHQNHPNARAYSDYRELFYEIGEKIDAVIVTTPDHTHAPVSLLAMEMGKSVYCQKPLTISILQARLMEQMARENNLTTQMGIQIRSSYGYKFATKLIQNGAIGKVKRVQAWSKRKWGFNELEPKEFDPVPEHLDWNLWLGDATKIGYIEGRYHPVNWRKMVGFGVGTLGDMGSHILDTPYNSLKLGDPIMIKGMCRQPNGYGYPEKNTVIYKFAKSHFTTENFELIWRDGSFKDSDHKDLKLPKARKLAVDGAIFIGEKGNLYLPHPGEPKIFIENEWHDLDKNNIELKNSLKKEKTNHYFQFIDTCLGKDQCSTPFSYGSKLTEIILLGTIACRFPEMILHWDSKKRSFKETQANKYL